MKEQLAQAKINEQLLLKSIKEVESSSQDLQKSLDQIEHKFQYLLGFMGITTQENAAKNKNKPKEDRQSSQQRKVRQP